jgi:hypothetical protein
VKPDIGATVGNANVPLHVFAGDVIEGADGKIKAFTKLLIPHAAGPGVFAGELPHVVEFTYLATIEWQPAVVGRTGDDENVLPLILNCTEKPFTAGTDGNTNVDPHVLAGSVSIGAEG